MVGGPIAVVDLVALNFSIAEYDGGGISDSAGGASASSPSNWFTPVVSVVCVLMVGMVWLLVLYAYKRTSHRIVSVKLSSDLADAVATAQVSHVRTSSPTADIADSIPDHARLAIE